jgi:NADPH:quinone reductase-like Zn-dependent oxidoreductase
MKAAYLNGYGGPEVIQYGEIPEPPLRHETDVLVRLKFAALNHLDVWVRRGLPHLKHQFPHVLCADGAGVIEKVGRQVSSVKVGDEVIVHPGLSCGHCERCLSGWESLCSQYAILGENVNGTAAQFIAVPEANVFLKPPALTLVQAASVPLVFTTAWQMVVNRGRVKDGDTVLVHAAGSGVSCAAIQLAALFGAKVMATAGSAAKLNSAKQLGAQVVINYRNEDFLSVVKAHTNKQGVDLIIDHTGRDQWEKNIRAVRSGGKLVLCGATSGYDAKLDLRHVFFRQLDILGSTMGSKGDFPRILQLLDAKHLSPIVDRIFPLEQVADAFGYLERREQFGKVLLQITE